MVPIPAARSLSIITSFLFQRSTNAPATGVTRILGNTNANPANARAVAVPVFSQAQIVRAKLVIAEPNIDVNCPSHMTVNPLMPDSVVVFCSISVQSLLGFKARLKSCTHDVYSQVVSVGSICSPKRKGCLAQSKAKKRIVKLIQL